MEAEAAGPRDSTPTAERPTARRASRWYALERLPVALTASDGVDVALVAVEDLVRALADLHDDRAVLARELGDEVQRHADPVGDRLVLVVDHLRQEVDEVALVDDDLVVVGAELLGDPAGVLELVVLLVLA